MLTTIICNYYIYGMVYDALKLYLSVRRGGEEAFAWFSQNGGSALGLRTGVRPHLSINSMREMVDAG